MNAEYLYRYIQSQLNSGVSRPGIVQKIMQYARLNQEEAENYVDNIDLNLQEYIQKFTPDPESLNSKEPEYKEKSLSQEIFEIVLSALILAFAFGVFFAGGTEAFSASSNLGIFFLISLLSISLGFIFHELGHRIVARRYGYIATFSMWIPGLLLALFLSFFSWIIAAPGAVVIRSIGNQSDDPHQHVSHLGKISITGPLINLGLALLFLLISLFYLVTPGFAPNSFWFPVFLILGAQINGMLAVFNLLPFGPFDGWKIIKWNKLAWFVSIAAAAVVFLFVMFTPWADSLNAPRSYATYSDPELRYSFSYPANWGEERKEITETHDVVYIENRNGSGVVGIYSYNLINNQIGIYMSDELLSDIKRDCINNFLESNEEAVLVKDNRVILNKGELEAYELHFLTGDDREIYLINVVTISGDYHHRIYFACLVEQYDIFLPVYDKLVESVYFNS